MCMGVSDSNVTDPRYLVVVLNGQLGSEFAEIRYLSCYMKMYLYINKSVLNVYNCTDHTNLYRFQTPVKTVHPFNITPFHPLAST